eukprot:9052723-Pyramimonas_sp.AAC.1
MDRLSPAARKYIEDRIPNKAMSNEKAKACNKAIEEYLSEHGEAVLPTGAMVKCCAHNTTCPTCPCLAWMAKINKDQSED